MRVPGETPRRALGAVLKRTARRAASNHNNNNHNNNNHNNNNHNNNHRGGAAAAAAGVSGIGSGGAAAAVVSARMSRGLGHVARSSSQRLLKQLLFGQTEGPGVEMGSDAGPGRMGSRVDFAGTRGSLCERRY
ncbi:unnamed protein product [Lampetra planeri]